jgi:branched-chain amino acid transport system permease protein
VKAANGATVQSGVIVAEPDVKPPTPTRSRRWSLLRPLAWVALVALAVAFAFNAGSFGLFLGSTVLVYAIAALGQDWLIGRAGQVSLGGAAVLAVGAYTTALTSGTWFENFPLPLILSGVIGAAVGVVIGLPALRLIGLYLLLSTLALQFFMQFLAKRYERDHPAGFVSPNMHIGSLDLSSERNMYLVVLGLLVLTALFLYNLYRRAPGKIWLSIKESQLATSTMGISLTRWKLAAFVGSSAITAVAGGLLAYVEQLVSSATFSLNLALSLIVMVYVGGQGTIIGPIIGATLVTLLPQGLQQLSQQFGSDWFSTNAALLDTLIYGLALLVVLLFERDGLTAIVVRIFRFGLGHVRRRRSPSTPATGTTLDGTRDAAEPASLAPVNPTGSEDRTSRTDRLLTVRDLTVRYPNGAYGVHGIDLDVPRGGIVALVGRNGAGKSSTIGAVAGFPRTARVSVQGSVLLEGRELAGLASSTISRLGVALVQERDKVFPSLSATDHLWAAGMPRRDIRAFLDRFSALQARADSPAGLLSGGQRQLLALAMCLSRRPELLVVDEMSLGLAPIAVKALIGEIRRARDEYGVTVLLVDQATAAVTQLADYIYVIENGRIAMAGAVDELEESEIRAAVIGGGTR